MLAEAGTGFPTCSGRYRSYSNPTKNVSSLVNMERGTGPSPQVKCTRKTSIFPDFQMDKVSGRQKYCSFGNSGNGDARQAEKSANVE